MSIERIHSNHEKHVNQNLTNCICNRKKGELRILKLLMDQSQDYVQKDLIAKLKESRTTVWKILKEMEKKGLIESTRVGSCKNYKVTDKGKHYYYDQHVNPVHRGMKMWVRVHNVRLKGDIEIDLPVNRMKKWKVYMTRSWKGHTRTFTPNDFTVTVNLTPKHAILYFSIVPAPTTDEAETRMGNAVGWVIKKLIQEDIYVTNLRQNTEASYASIYEPISEHFYKHKIAYDGSAFSIDHSHDVPELEYHNKEQFENYRKFVEYLGNGKLDPDTLAEMQDDHLCSKDSHSKTY